MMWIWIGMTVMSLAWGIPAGAGVEKPEVVRFGNGIADMESALQGLCASMRTRAIDPPFLDGVQEIQHQIDCEGFAYMGRPRRAEFVFRDGTLEMVWILVQPEEQAGVVDAMRRRYGSEGMRGNRFLAFPEHRTAWRFSPPEILFYSAELAPQIERWFSE